MLIPIVKPPANANMLLILVTLDVSKRFNPSIAARFLKVSKVTPLVSPQNAWLEFLFA